MRSESYSRHGTHAIPRLGLSGIVVALVFSAMGLTFAKEEPTSDSVKKRIEQLKHKDKAAKALRFTSKDLVHLGVVDEVIPEPLGGAHRDHFKMAATLKGRLVEALGKPLRPFRFDLPMVGYVAPKTEV